MGNVVSIFIAGILLFASTIFMTLAHAEDTKTIRVGAVLSLTGVASAHGRAIQDGLEFAKFELEKKGWKIDLQYDDDGTVPRRTVNAIQRLASLGTRLFIGPTWGILADSARPVINGCGGISLQPANSSDFVKGVNDRYFFFFPPPTRASTQLLEFLRPFKGHKVAIFNNVSPWGELWGQLFAKAVADAGAELVATEMLQFSELEQSVPAIISKFQNRGVEVILSTTSKESEALTVKTLEAQRLRSVFLGLDLPEAISDGLVANGSPYVEGFAVIEKFQPEFVKSYQLWKGHTPRRYAEFAYDALFALSVAVENVGSDPDRVKQFLGRTLDIKGITGQLCFDESHDVTGTGYELRKVIERR